MSDLSRRAFLGASVIAVETLRQSLPAIAAPQCVTGFLPSFLPNRLTADCASRRNFQLFRQNSIYLGLAGMVSMSFVRGGIGSYEAGNLFLFPWLKPKGVALGIGKVWSSVAPRSATRVISASPIPNWTLPIDDYLCNYILKAPGNYFLGFAVDGPVPKDQAQWAWFTNVDKLADGQGAGIDWTSANLNDPWFGGSKFIPNSDTCNGNAWRALVVDGLNQASSAVC
jgi:hypothetical protein